MKKADVKAEVEENLFMFIEEVDGLEYPKLHCTNLKQSIRNLRDIYKSLFKALEVEFGRFEELRAMPKPKYPKKYKAT